MRKFLITLVAFTSLAMWSPTTASASVDVRQDSFYTVMCLVDGVPVAFESVDARAIEQGGKDRAIANFMEHTGYDCSRERPFTS